MKFYLKCIPVFLLQFLHETITCFVRWSAGVNAFNFIWQKVSKRGSLENNTYSRKTFGRRKMIIIMHTRYQVFFRIKCFTSRTLTLNTFRHSKRFTLSNFSHIEGNAIGVDAESRKTGDAFSPGIFLWILFEIPLRKFPRILPEIAWFF